MGNRDSFLYKFLRGVLWVLLAFCAYLVIFGIWSVYVTSPNHDVEKAIVYADKEEISDEPGRSMYSQLNDVEQTIYRTVRDAVENNKSSLSMEFPGYTLEEIEASADRAFSAVYYDYPEYIWWNGEKISRCVNDVFSKKTVNAQFEIVYHDYWAGIADKEKYCDEMMIRARIIASRAKKLESVYEQVKYVHDYLVKNVFELNRGKAEEATVEGFQSFTAYGALINHLATSEGYAKAFQLIMSMMDIECEYVEGECGTIEHAWNYVGLDNEYYWVDVSEDDYNWEDRPNAIAYDYFCFTSEELFNSYYELPETFDFPECTATEYNYFYKEGFYLEEFDYDIVCRLLEKERGSEMISFKFSNRDESVKFASVMIHDEHKLQQLPYYKDQRCGFKSNPYI